MMGITDFEVIPAQNEKELQSGLSPEEAVRAIALSKARDVAAALDDDTLVIAADTLVYLNGYPIGKPKDAEDAKVILQRLSDSRHTVFTGIAVIMGEKELVSAEASDVYFRPLSGKEINWYVSTGEPLDKAGAYGIQGYGSVFVRKIDGDFYNVMGLPVYRLCLMLRRFGVEIAGDNDDYSER